MKIIRRTLWSNDIFELHLPNIDNDSIKQYYIEKKKQFPEGVRRSNRGGWQFDIPAGECKAIDELVYNIEVATQELFYNTFKLDFEIRMALCWLNSNPKFASNAMHTHPKSIFSGVYYIDVVDVREQGAIRFLRNERVEFILDQSECKTPDPLFTSDVQFPPKKSHAYLFAPWLMHEVEPNQLDTERLILAFNFVRANDMKSNVHLNSAIR